MSRKRTVPFCTTEEFAAIVRQVREIAQFPKGIKVVYQRVSAEEAADTRAWTQKDGRTFTISVFRGMSEPHTEEILLHETGHVLDWRPYHVFTSAHGPTFWVMYGELYCRYHEVR